MPSATGRAIVARQVRRALGRYSVRAIDDKIVDGEVLVLGSNAYIFLSAAKFQFGQRGGRHTVRCSRINRSMDAIAVGFTLGFGTSLLAGGAVFLLGAWVQQPDVKITGEPYREDLTYRVAANGATEIRIRDDLVPPPAGSYEKNLSYYSLWVDNRHHGSWPLSMFPRSTAWATDAVLSFRPFTPDSQAHGGSILAFGYYGRWAGAPEPTGPGSIEAGRYMEIPPRRKVSMTLAQKYDGDKSAWGFTNESYHWVAAGSGLWRNPAFEMPLHSDWEISIRFETTRRFPPEKFHAAVVDATRHGLTVHRWRGCADCKR